MLYNFDTTDELKAKAALILYALYRSRDVNSPLNGLETWTRAESFCKGACLKSKNTAEFVTRFKTMAKIGSIKPRYLSDPEGLTMLPDGTVVQSDAVKNYRLSLFEDDRIREIIEREYPIIVMLVRERIQREKMAYTEEADYEED